MKYSFKVVRTDKPNKAMEILYSCEGMPDLLVGTRMPYIGESLDSIVAMYAPLEYWKAYNAEVEDVTEGIHGVVDPTPIQDTIVDKLQSIISVIQLRLDAFASTRGYDSILSACSYATSTDPKFAAEGQRAVVLRDATWSAAYALFDKVTSGEIAEPASYDEIEPLLPELTWTN